MIKLFNKWSTEGIKVQDAGLVDFINLKQIYVPKTGGRNVKIRFHKSKNNAGRRIGNRVGFNAPRGWKKYGLCFLPGRMPYELRILRNGQDGI